MPIETLTLLASLLGCGGMEPTQKPVKLPPGPNLKTPSPTTVEPYQVVFPKRISWSPDGGVAHYQLLYQNRKGTPKAGWTVIGYFVDVSTGKIVATYNWETKGFMCPSLAPIWKKGRTRAWAVKFLKDHGFVKQNKKRKRTRPPGRKHGIRLKLTTKKTRIGWISTADTWRYFRWEFSTVWRKTTAEDKVDARIQLQLKKKGVKGVSVLHTHQPYLDYHYSLTHLHNWKQAVEREEGDTPTICSPEAALSPEQCAKEKKKYGLTRRDRYPFTGEVWVYWNHSDDALLAFWDDRQVRGVDTDTSHGVYRSYVTVHSVAPRQPSPLIAKLAAAKPAPPMKKAMAATAKAMKAPDMQATMDMAAAAMSGGDKKKDSASKKKGCGCQHGAPATFPGLALLVLVVLGLSRKRRRSA